MMMIQKNVIRDKRKRDCVSLKFIFKNIFPICEPGLLV
jgi:hypothetical protein